MFFQIPTVADFYKSSIQIIGYYLPGKKVVD